MALDAALLRRKVGAGGTVTDQDLTDLITQAATLVTHEVGDVEVPEEILDRAHLLTAVQLYNQDAAPNGIVNQQFAADDGTAATPIRIARDPLAAARPVLAPWISAKFWVG
ncbi:hypothetical protein P5P86_11780 [Nocardioides sp. BP30]|uniref:hypothetical protein n=1 Tax=Nocardioides sp. BP30 TaxID=3036374 RepID=UPI0024695E07|nr:hypothetical protein [Nocardioides sp. BP30]WGL50644.1 hypothetical protein P5P86_11780 [Nocardioides sp. BP30]